MPMRSARKIAEACVERVGFMAIVALQAPFTPFRSSASRILRRYQRCSYLFKNVRGGGADAVRVRPVPAPAHRSLLDEFIRWLC
jgi:hypothetical protein